MLSDAPKILKLDISTNTSKPDYKPNLVYLDDNTLQALAALLQPHIKQPTVHSKPDYRDKILELYDQIMDQIIGLKRDSSTMTIDGISIYEYSFIQTIKLERLYAQIQILKEIQHGRNAEENDQPVSE